MWPFKEKKEEVINNEPTSLFSTEWVNTRTSNAMKNRLAISFQKGIESFKPVGQDGKLVEGFAMDGCAGYTQSGLVNSRIQGIPDVQMGWYAGQGFIGWQAAAILSQNWLIDKACSMPAKDASRNGYEITVNDGTKVDPEVLEEMRKADKKFNISGNCVEFVKMGRVFGIRVALFVVESDDDDYYLKPFNPDGVTKGSYKGISQIDPYWITPELDQESAANPASMHFYEPTWWRVNGKRIHRSHLVIMRNGDLPDILKPTYIYGGIPVPQKIAERVYASERTANEAPMLAMSKRLTVLRLDMSQVVANQAEFECKMQLWTELMNNYGVKIIGGEEEIQQFDTSLADLDAVIMTQYQLVSAASNVPVTKLLGTTPKGFNATGEYDEKSYHEELESIQEHDLTALVERHHLLLIRSYIAPMFKIAPFSTEVNWNPTDSPSAAELADINNKNAVTDKTLSESGAIDGEDIRNRLITDKNSGYNGLEASKDLDDDEEIDA